MHDGKYVVYDAEEQMKQKISVLKSCLKQSTQKDSQSRIHIRNRMEVLTQNVHQHLSMHSQVQSLLDTALRYGPQTEQQIVQSDAHRHSIDTAEEYLQRQEGENS
jgi:hypothetical protein